MITTRRSFAALPGSVALALIAALSSSLTAAESLPVSAVHIQVPAYLQPSVDTMFRRSATFRSQYRRLTGAARLVVVVNVDPLIMVSRFRARSTIRRYDSGLIVALVSVGPRGDLIEWLAHEFEHIVEQLDGWNLREMARRGGHGAWYSGTDVIETTRAARAGRAVLQEVRERIRRPDKLVE